MAEQLLICPTCGSSRVIVREVTSFQINTGEYFCNSVKSHDSDAATHCMDCDWNGRRYQLKENGK